VDHQDIIMTTVECHRLAHMDGDLQILTLISDPPRLENIQHTMRMTDQVSLERNLLHLYQDLKQALLVKPLRWMQQQEVLQQHQRGLASLAISEKVTVTLQAW
jgi:replicative DNA helicase